MPATTRSRRAAARKAPAPIAEPSRILTPSESRDLVIACAEEMYPTGQSDTWIIREYGLAEGGMRAFAGTGEPFAVGLAQHAHRCLAAGVIVEVRLVGEVMPAAANLLIALRHYLRVRGFHYNTDMVCFTGATRKES